jgi:hypothetical protein
MKVYLSSPYEHSRASPLWKVESLKHMLNVDSRVEAIDPCPSSCNEASIVGKIKADKDWMAMYAFCNNIVESDLAMLRRCEGMICYLPSEARTVGCIHEIIFALQHSIPLVLVTPEGIDKVSHWLWGILGPTRIFDNLEKACRELVIRMQVARGEKTNATVYYTSR